MKSQRSAGTLQRILHCHGMFLALGSWCKGNKLSCHRMWSPTGNPWGEYGKGNILSYNNTVPERALLQCVWTDPLSCDWAFTVQKGTMEKVSLSCRLAHLLRGGRQWKWRLVPRSQSSPHQCGASLWWVCAAHRHSFWFPGIEPKDQRIVKVGKEL